MHTFCSVVGRVCSTAVGDGAKGQQPPKHGPGSQPGSQPELDHEPIPGPIAVTRDMPKPGAELWGRVSCLE